MHCTAAAWGDIHWKASKGIGKQGAALLLCCLLPPLHCVLYSSPAQQLPTRLPTCPPPSAAAVDAGSGGQASGGRAPPDLASNNSRPGPTQLHPGASPLSRGESGAMAESSPRPSGSGGLPGGGQPPLVGQPSTSSGLGAPAAGQQAAALLARASSGSLQQPSSARAGSGPLPEQSPGGWLASIPPFQTAAGPAAHAVNGVAAPGAGGVPLTESLRELSMALQVGIMGGKE